MFLWGSVVNHEKVIMVQAAINQSELMTVRHYIVKPGSAERFKGFTLIELLVVIAIIAILAAFCCRPWRARRNGREEFPA